MGLTINAACGPLFLAIQHAMANETKAAPVIPLTTCKLSSLKGIPRSIGTMVEGIAIKARPVAPSNKAVAVNTDFMKIILIIQDDLILQNFN
jgi:hypothetical protein